MNAPDTTKTDKLLPTPSAVGGGALMSFAMLCFVVNDTVAKTMGGQVNVGEFIMIRGLFASSIIAVMVVLMGKVRDVPKALSKQVMLRTLFDVASTFSFIIALFNMPLSILSSILQSVPLVVTLMAAAFLGEAVGWRRLSAILVGFAGVLLIVKPGAEGFNNYFWLSLFCVLLVALRDLATRNLSIHVPSIVVALANSIGVMLGGLIWTLFYGFQLPTGSQLGWIAVRSVFLVGGYLTTVMALRDSEIANTAPFRYTLIIYALILRYLVFGEVPDLWAMIGIVLIVGSGLFTLYREQQLKKHIGFGRRPVR